jgi:hypothetical protein
MARNGFSDLSYAKRRKLAILILVVGLPLYIAAAAVAVSAFDRPHFLVELGIYAFLGIAWALPFRAIFRGVGREDPDAGTDGQGGDAGPHSK